MKTITAKVADLTAAAESIYNNIYTAEGEKEAAKIRKLAAKMDVGFEDALMAMLVKQIKFGAIKVNGFWHPVVDGAVIERAGATHSGGALNTAAHYAGQHNIVLKF